MNEAALIAGAIRDVIETMQDYDSPEGVILDRLEIEPDKPSFTAFYEGEQYRVTVEKVTA